MLLTTLLVCLELKENGAHGYQLTLNYTIRKLKDYMFVKLKMACYITRLALTMSRVLKIMT